MEENVAAASQTNESAPAETPKVAKSGQPVAGAFPFQPKAGDNNGAAPAAATPVKTTPENKDDKGSTGNNSPAETTDPSINEDQLRAYFESQGIPFESIDSLKSKLTAQAAPAELTPEQKEQIETTKRKRIVEEHLSRKGTVDQLAAFEKVASFEDTKALGLDREVSELVAEGFTKEEAAALAKERYFQYTDAEIAEVEDEKDRTALTKKRELGAKKLERKGAFIQKTAKDYLNTLESDLTEKDAEALKLEQHTSNVEDAVKKYQRKLKLEIGQVDDQKIDPIDFEVSETAISSAKALLSDRLEFEKQLLTKDGHVNLDFILPHLVKSFAMDGAVKTGYLVAQDRTIEQLKAKFGSIPKLGAAAVVKNGNGKVVSAGQPRVGRPEFK